MTTSKNAPIDSGSYSFSTTAGADLIQRVKMALGADGTNPTDLAYGQATKAASVPVTIASDHNGQATKANSLPVVLASDQMGANTKANSLPVNIASDQLGAAAKTASLSVTVATDQGSIAVAEAGIATPTLANVSGSATSVTVFSSNANARQRMLQNDSTAILYLKFGSGAASTTSYTVQIPAGQYFEFPFPCYTGASTVAWSAANGAARTTEVTA